jgi:hypothetical protein
MRIMLPKSDIWVASRLSTYKTCSAFWKDSGSVNRSDEAQYELNHSTNLDIFSLYFAKPEMLMRPIRLLN